MLVDPSRPWTDERLMIDPPPARAITGAAYFTPANAAFTATASEYSKSSSLRSAMPPDFPL